MAGKKGRPSARDTILEAAVAVVSEVGAGHMTLESVAERAGVSKGGLLYHFPSKDALLKGMVQCFVDRTGEREAQMRAELAGSPNRDIQALVRARLECQGTDRAAARSMLAAVSASPQMLDPIREDIRQTVEKIAATSTDPTFDRVLWLAVEGMAFLDLMDVSPFDEEERAQVVASILRLAVHGGTVAAEAGAEEPAATLPTP